MDGSSCGFFFVLQWDFLMQIQNFISPNNIDGSHINLALNEISSLFSHICLAVQKLGRYRTRNSKRKICSIWKKKNQIAWKGEKYKGRRRCIVKMQSFLIDAIVLSCWTHFVKVRQNASDVFNCNYYSRLRGLLFVAPLCQNFWKPNVSHIRCNYRTLPLNC